MPFSRVPGISALAKEPSQYAAAIPAFQWAGLPHHTNVRWFSKKWQNFTCLVIIKNQMGCCTSMDQKTMNPWVCLYVSLVRKAEILHLLSQPKSEAKITVVPTNSFILGRHHKDNIATNNGPRKTEDHCEETGRAAQERGSHGHAVLLSFRFIHRNPGRKTTASRPLAIRPLAKRPPIHKATDPKGHWVKRPQTQKATGYKATVQ